MKFKDTNELCAKCMGGYKLSDDFSECLSIHKFEKWGEASDSDDMKLEADLIIESFEMDVRLIDDTVIQKIKANEESEHFSFI
jgi:hypothetical protein